MKRPLCLLLTALVVARLGPAARADNWKAELDCAANVRLLDTHFASYGYAPSESLDRQVPGVVHFQLPSGTEGVGQTGLYSYFALAGDFEVSALYEWISVPAPETGYGVSCGIAVQSKGTGESVSLARGHLPDKGSGYTVTRGQKGESGMQYETSHYPTQAESGRLVLRREKAELICLVADGDKEPLREVCRVPFPDGTVRPVRIFADPGGSPTEVDARLGRIRVRAEEITAGIPKKEKSQGLGWWAAMLALLFGAALVFWFFRRQRQQ